MTVALDPSSTACGWAVFRGLELIARGTVKRGKNTLTDYANECADDILHAADGDPFDVLYEINDRQKIPRERQRSMRLQAQGTGRILQALGVEGQERQADSRTKERRALECSLIYGIEDCPANEHVLDAVALGHAVVTNPERLAKS
jgi:hypothetical protein